MSEILQPQQSDAQLKNYDQLKETFHWDDIHSVFSWYETGNVNMAYECIDRHVDDGRGDHPALRYADSSREETYTFADLKGATNQAAHMFRRLEVAKGDRVFIFMPRSPELYISLLGAIKAGAVAGPLFEAFMNEAVRSRLEDSEASTIVTTPELLERIPYTDLPHLNKIILVGDQVPQDGPFYSYFNEMKASPTTGDAIEWVSLEDGMILHYTSGSTGKPKGVYHVHHAMIQHYQTAKWVLDLDEDDVFWCTADPGWVTGTSYGIFGPWLNGVTNIVRGGRFSPDDWYHTIEKQHVTVWYSAPTAFRMLMAAPKEIIEKYDLSSLRHILSVGEPLNPEVVRWGWEVFGLRIHDTWWMTETGAMLICNYPSEPIKPGSMGKPIPGVHAAIIDDQGKELPPNEMGNLAVQTGWPAQMRKIWKNETKFNEYFSIPGWYISGDTAFRDEDGYFWFQGRNDDVIVTAGERVGPFEIESKLVEHPSVAEAGVIGKPDEMRGHIIKAFIAVRDGYEHSDELKEEIRSYIKNELSAHSVPREIEFKETLPKTRSGKIMRRVLKAWELDEPAGDLSTMDDN
ncbi:acetate--CoA ligase [Salisediminibacterium halotolerans]|uniref:acetate--CoA ligase n=1 Tax=Salisediminibacterium halotolerans TaxID=517425 RepID=UPI000F135093|nr:acetate--CoA ligase [Salisediminibacterium halotolerans]RLJ77867.1 acetyl-CoA synthetase [Actinophytocola xinjiangensis]RPE88795.1 acetyl-CoA synthetase [Salisediminibacterium halotolerans]TWG36844.1 acetyl-CoA synthetase [Salisediminibacterium halotolerans]GEL07981.1 acetyl-coenzyme A synthetase [Salisediminibacterium halotolerans]